MNKANKPLSNKYSNKIKQIESVFLKNENDLTFILQSDEEIEEIKSAPKPKIFSIIRSKKMNFSQICNKIEGYDEKLNSIKETIIKDILN
jgi:hypothetical protein